MRVAVLGQMLNTNHADKIVGGIQTVERLHLRILTDLGHEVTFIASADTAVLSDLPALKYKLTTLPSEEGVGKSLTKADKSRLSREKTKEIREMIDELNPQFIICHSYSSSHVKLVADLSLRIPSMIFVHQTPAVAMDISMIAKVEAYLRLTNNGGKLMMTSPYQRGMWHDVLSRRINSGSEHFSFITISDLHRIYDWIVPSAYMNHYQLQSAQDHFVVVSRPDPAKNVVTLFELLKWTKAKIHVKFFVAWPGDLASNDYWAKRLSPAITQLQQTGHTIEVFQNAPRDAVLKGIATAKGMFLPGPNESSPMTLMEATQYGVWPITFAKRRDSGVLENAAATMLQPNQLSVIDAFNKDKLSAVVEFDSAIDKVQSLTLNDRIAYRDTVYQAHSYKERKKDLCTAMGNLLWEFKPKSKQFMEF